MQEKCIFCNREILIDSYLDYAAKNCLECKSTQFELTSSKVDSSIYTDDFDYLDDIETLKNVDDALMWHHNLVLADIIKKSSANICDTKGLDIGCFNGFFVRKLLDQKINFFGIDFNSKAIDDGIRRFNLADRIKVQDASNGLGVEKYDFVTCFEVIEHVADPSNVVDVIKSVLAKDGTAYISCPNANMIWHPPLDNPPHHLSRITPLGLKTLFEAKGFRVIKHYEQMSILDLLRHRIGIFFRDSNNNSMRGGKIKNSFLTRLLRLFINKSQNIIKLIISPIDKLFYFIGFRYIGQVIIVKRIT